MQEDDMLGIRRVMPDTVVLPNGKVAILHGAQNGRAGYAKKGWAKGGQASNPNTVSLLYDPYAPVGKRFKKLSPTPIVRMYHSSACLHPTGEIVVAGCDVAAKYAGVPEGAIASPDGLLDFRLQLITPNEISLGVERPKIVTAPKIITRGRPFTVDYEYGADIIGASLVAPCGTTHSIGMNQRVIMLKVTSAADGRAVIEAPPSYLPALALKGHYLLFLLGKSRTYSEGVWLQLH
ncbi:Galactose oxidase [Tetrabaena socialis]|uniref:Galactose oxidase n=1 Tax=Tetrabaena socialis TaxID=47790 RepID=A0A2J8A130_9CHLO|nr:Galactose oxidase [Tetrabaena socialis]|eukprot:PNH06227.1 Galactose oxidase [Tetrabaena socialis]